MPVRKPQPRLPRSKQLQLRGYPFPKLDLYITQDGDTVYMCKRHRAVVNPSDIDESLREFDDKFTEGCCEHMASAHFQRLLNILTCLAAER